MDVLLEIATVVVIRETSQLLWWLDGHKELSGPYSGWFDSWDESRWLQVIRACSGGSHYLVFVTEVFLEPESNSVIVSVGDFPVFSVHQGADCERKGTWDNCPRTHQQFDSLVEIMATNTDMLFCFVSGDAACYVEPNSPSECAVHYE